MSSWKQFLVCAIITLSCISILELCYVFFAVFSYFNEFTWSGLIITFVLNAFIIFFAVSTIAGVTTENFGLLVTCLGFIFLEFCRTCKGLYESWSDGDETKFNRFYITMDAVILISTMIFLTPLIFIINKEQKESSLSFIGRSLERQETQETTT